MLPHDYYDILELNRSAELSDVREAYRRCSLRFHPAKSVDSNAKVLFHDVSEAYQVLSNQRLRALYDQYGRRGLGLAQWIDKHHSGEPPYSQDPKFDKVEFKDASVIFEEFFATANPYAAELRGNTEKDFVREKLPQPPLQKKFYCTLEEIYQGTTKTINIYTKNETKSLTIQVERGWRSGTFVKFHAVGEETERLLPADACFTLEECPHPRFRREGDNLVYTHTISLKDALCGAIISVRTLDDRLLSIPINFVVSPGKTHKIKGEGMPIANSSKFGDMILEFDITFPKEIKESTKEAVQNLQF